MLSTDSLIKSRIADMQRKLSKSQGIRHGAETMIGEPFDTELAKAYPEYRLVVVVKVATCNLIEFFYNLLKNKLNIKKMKFASGDNCASVEF